MSQIEFLVEVLLAGILCFALTVGAGFFLINGVKTIIGAVKAPTTTAAIGYALAGALNVLVAVFMAFLIFLVFTDV